MSKEDDVNGGTGRDVLVEILAELKGVRTELEQQRRETVEMKAGLVHLTRVVQVGLDTVTERLATFEALVVKGFEVLHQDTEAVINAADGELEDVTARLAKLEGRMDVVEKKAAGSRRR